MKQKTIIKIVAAALLLGIGCHFYKQHKAKSVAAAAPLSAIPEGFDLPVEGTQNVKKFWIDEKGAYMTQLTGPTVRFQPQAITAEEYASAYKN